MGEPVVETPRAMSDAAYYLLAVLVGTVAGAVGAAFHLLYAYAMEWPALVLPYFEGPEVLAVLAAVSAAMVLVSVLLVRTFAPEAAGSGVQEIEGALDGQREVRWKRILPVKFVAGILSLGSGLVLGREGPTIHMGASVAKAVGDGFVLGVRDGRGLLAAGGAAGLAAAFNAPLAAILFVIEETRRQFPYGLRTYSAVIIASVVSAIVTEIIGGTAPMMALETTEMPFWLMPAFAGLGVLLGALGVIFNWAVVAALELSRKIGLKASPYLVPLVVGAAIGPLLVLRPEATTGGEALAVSLATHHLPLLTMAVIVVVRFVMTMASYSTGVPGGIFAPILALATSAGILFAMLLELALPLPPGAIMAFGVAAMGGLFSSTVRAPLVGMVLVAELTGGYNLMIPVIITCVCANVVAEALGGKPIYEVLLERTLLLAGKTPPKAPEDEPIGGWDERERRSPEAGAGAPRA
ncbi:MULTISPECIES: H(+)/Cl(-) exchange transporter ClcA [Xanthobacter]|uniref:H(+)/Cl(-) exchange transporter ClcA n=1 Tax=Xanthobacter TaxID=279 RepID=UPI001F27A593|nr:MULTISPECIES: H(+)/Cl(-) exchange transporter ClcA [unclassified Xanthobacter]